MRYSDEGNLRFSGNIRASSVEPTPSQGYYREELEDGKYSITLTNNEPGLGYFGFNEDELTYDIDNHALCTKNISADGDISATDNASFGGNVSSTGDITSEGSASFGGDATIAGDITSKGSLSVDGDISSGGNATVTGGLSVDGSATVGGNISSAGGIHSTGCIISGNNLSVSGDISATGNITAPGGTIQGLTGRFMTLCGTNNNYLGYLNLGNPGNAAIKDKCNTTVLGAYDGNLYLRGTCYKVAEAEYDTSCKSSIEMYGGQIHIKNQSSLGETKVQLDNNDSGKGAVILSNCLNGNSMGLCLLDNKARLKPVYIDPAYMELDANSISTSCACLLLKNAVCVPDIFTVGAESSTQCHYIHTISQNGTSATSSDGTLTLGAAVNSVTVSGVTCTVGSDGSITLPDLTKSITIGNVTCAVDSSGSITLPNYARCVMINGVSGCADADGKVDMGTLTAVLTVNLKGSAIISDSSTINPDKIYNSIVMGKDAAQADPTVDTCCNVLVGYNVKGDGCRNVAIGSGAIVDKGTAAFAPDGAISIGCGAGSYANNGIAIGTNAKACGNSSVGIGIGSCTGMYAVAIGCDANAANFSVSIGCTASSLSSGIAIGHYAKNGVLSGIAIGDGANTSGYSSACVLVDEKAGKSIRRSIICWTGGTKQCDLFNAIHDRFNFNKYADSSTVYVGVTGVYDADALNEIKWNKNETPMKFDLGRQGFTNAITVYDGCTCLIPDAGYVQIVGYAK